MILAVLFKVVVILLEDQLEDSHPHRWVVLELVESRQTRGFFLEEQLL